MPSESVPVRWLEPPPQYQFGTTFGLPWHKGRYKSGDTTFTCTTHNGQEVQLQTWVTAYWPDDSIKWTAHAIPAGDAPKDGYIVHAGPNDEVPPSNEPQSGGLRIQDSADAITVSTGAVTATFPKAGHTLISRLVNSAGRTVCTNGHLVLLTQSAIPDDDDVPASPITHRKLTSTITSTTTLSHGGRTGPAIRATIKITGHHTPPPPHHQEPPLLPFTLLITLHAHSPLLRLHLTHTISLDNNNNHTTTTIRGLALRLAAIPLAPAAPFNHHIRLTTATTTTTAAAADATAAPPLLLAEAAQGLTGLWKDPGAAVREAQVRGQPVAGPETWEGSWAAGQDDETDEGEKKRGTGWLRWVPVWREWRVVQGGPHESTVRKRTGRGRGWVGVPGGNDEAGGVAYVGAAGLGGVAVGLRWFRERWPTRLDVGAGDDDGGGELTAWMWSPDGGPMDLRPWRGGLGEEGFDDQLEAMRVTYEDWEEGMGSAHGVARTSELCLLVTRGTPGEGELAALTRLQQDLDSKLDFLFNFYKGQVEQRKWYGFWDHGDIMHTYDADRHTWRYDVGGYAWDNSELSPDLWLWLYFLRTGRADVYRMAEALTRHTGEVDVYHLGKYKGLGTRHGVQHWSDSCKQARISNALYRRYFYYLSGGDERVGDLMEETLETEKTFLTLDPYRKVRKDRDTYRPDPTALTISLGTDWSALAAAWFIEWERRGPKWKEAKNKLLTTIKGIGSLRNGFVTGQVTYNLLTGEISPPAEDPENNGVVKISHLSAMFGLFEICSDILDSLEVDTPPGFKKAWLDYCYYFNAPAEEQIARFGVSFGNLQLRQGHSRLTAYASRELVDSSLATRAWNELLFSDGYTVDAPWITQKVNGHGVEEAPWISTNITSLYGLAAIQNLAIIGKSGGSSLEPEL
ncbi:hypothetical protein SLS58_006951 [Diplodia intermedia]|uniref:Uncharacterized protein n=1 Tax=Diplodia intermedia TaxID=856260 RepID=A0ABR3TM61_9PEZI